MAEKAAPVAAPVVPGAAPQKVAVTRRDNSRPAQVVPADKELKRKERISDIKVEMHKRLLEDLNLAALEQAPEKELRAEISAITAEALTDLGWCSTGMSARH